MKKKIIAICMTALTLSSSMLAASCGSMLVPSTSESASAGKEAVPFVETLNDFETLADLYCNDYDNGTSRLFFGKVKLNKDKNYVTSGNASVCFDVHGSYAEGGQPTVASFIFGEKDNYVNFSRLKNITFDLFNETGKEQLIGIALGFDGKKMNYEYITVKEGLNNISYSPDLLGLSIAGDLTKGESVSIDFAKPETIIGEAPYNRFYMDNLQIEYALKATSGIEIELETDETTGVYEIAYFEKYYQQYIMETHCIGPAYSSLPTLTVNADPTYTKGNTGKSLKVAYPISAEPMNDGWPGFAFIPSLWEEFNLTQMAVDEKEFVFDVYNTGSDYSLGFYVNPLETKKSTGYSAGFIAKGGQWTEVRIPVADWNKFMESEGEDTLKMNLTDNIGKIFILCNKTSVERTFYFDNFRFENKKA